MKKTYHIILAALLFPVVSLAQQKQVVTATVVTKDNKPVAGAVVRLKSDPSHFVVTQADGKFTIEIPEGKALEISQNNTDKITVRPRRDNMTIVFDKSTREVYYGFDIKHNELESTAAVSTVEFDKLEETAVFNPEQALYGRLPGLSVMRTGGSPWSNISPDMLIRGKGTMNNNSILVLIDGIERPLSALSLEDIESVSVLKDAATLALYGQRGANGVLAVKTKRGKYNTNTIKVNYSHGLTRPISMPEMVDGYGYALAMNEARGNDGLSPMFSDYDLADLQNGSQPYLLPDVNWFKEALRSHGTQDIATFSARGGNNIVAYYALLEYQNEKGLYKPVKENDGYSTQLERNVFNASARLDARLTRTTELFVNSFVNIAQYRRPGVEHGNLFKMLYNTPPTAFPIRTPDGTWGGNPLYMEDNLSNNPVAQIAGRGYVSNHSRRLSVDGGLRQDFSFWVPGLSADLRVGYDNMAEYADRKPVNSFLYTVMSYTREPDGSIPEENITRTRYGADAVISTSTTFNNQWRRGFLQGRINYDQTWGRHSFSATAAYYQEKYIGNGQYSTFLHQSIIGQIHYGYDRRYMVDLAMSYSGSNYLEENNRFRYYPAISAAWVLSNEPFLAGNKAVNMLKLRASYGLSGNNNMDQNLFVQAFTKGGGYNFTEENSTIGGWIENQLATKKLSPELSRMLNVGIDYQFFGGLWGSIDGFYSRRSKILQDSGNTTSGILGVSAPMICSGIVENSGLEVSLNWEKTSGDFDYFIGGQFAYSRNKIIHMEEQFRPYDYMKRTGQRIGQPFGLKKTGYFNNQQEIDEAYPQSWGQLRPGDARYADQNGDGKIDQNDVVPISRPNGYPGMYFSLNAGLEWKGLGFTVLFQGAADMGINLNTVSIYKGLIDNVSVSRHVYENSWSANRQTSARYPRLTSQKNDNNYQTSDIWQVDNPFLKLRNAQIYYKLPDRWVKKMKMADFKLFVKGFDLFSIDRIKAGDPEYIGSGYPMLSTYHLGLNFSF